MCCGYSCHTCTFWTCHSLQCLAFGTSHIMHAFLRSQRMQKSLNINNLMEIIKFASKSIIMAQIKDNFTATVLNGLMKSTAVLVLLSYKIASGLHLITSWSNSFPELNPSCPLQENNCQHPIHAHAGQGY